MPSTHQPRHLPLVTRTGQRGTCVALFTASIAAQIGAPLSVGNGAGAVDAATEAGLFLYLGAIAGAAVRFAAGVVTSVGEMLATRAAIGLSADEVYEDLSNAPATCLG
jgi:hypothetical protein